MMGEIERNVFLDMAWFPGDSDLCGHSLRPLSLGSYQALRLMGQEAMLEPDASLFSPLEQTRQAGLYIWLHEKPVVEIGRALWTGAWQQIYEAHDEPTLEVAAEFAALRARHVLLLEAAAIEIRPRDRAKSDDTPMDVVGPTNMAFTLAVMARETGWSRDEILWQLPLCQAMQIYHAGLRWAGQWTVRPGSKVDVAEFEDFTVPGIDTPPVA